MKSLSTCIMLISAINVNLQQVCSQQIQTLREDKKVQDVYGRNKIWRKELDERNIARNNTATPSIDTLQFLLELYNEIYNVQNLADFIVEEDSQCMLEFNLFLDQLFKEETWALRMFDASAKLQSGILEGNVMNVGNYDECINIRKYVNGTQIYGKYCTAVLTDVENLTIDFHNVDEFALLKMSQGLCIPASCNSTSLEPIIAITEIMLNLPFHVKIFDEVCISRESPQKMSSRTIISIVIFSTFGIIIVLSTIYDIMVFRKKKERNPNILIAFSFYSNGKKLFSTKTTGDSLHCINGMRVISLMWILAGHRYMYFAVLPLINLLDFMTWDDKYQSTFVTASNIAVDTFFVISALLIVYVFLSYKEKGRETSIPMFYIHRILRLTPSLAMVVLFYAGLLDKIGTGPFWPAVVLHFQDGCKTNWWQTLLYVQNYVNPENICMGHSWYLAVDTQLYFLSPLLLFPIIKWPKQTTSAILFLLCLSCAATFFISWERKMGPTFYGVNQEGMAILYTPTHVRIPPWLVGFLTGYIIFNNRHKSIKISKSLVIFIWLASFGFMLGIILYHVDFRQVPPKVDIIESALINSLSRLVWAIALSAMIFLCVNGYGGVINKLLSCRIFTVLIRLNYSMYLLHILVIIYNVGQSRTPQFMSVIDKLYEFWGDFCMTLILSIIWTLAFESPILVLENILFRKKKTPSLPVSVPARINNNLTQIVTVDQLATTAKLQ